MSKLEIQILSDQDIVDISCSLRTEYEACTLLKEENSKIILYQMIKYKGPYMSA